MQALETAFHAPSRDQFRPGLRHLTIFFSDIAGFSDLARTRGDVEAARIVNRLLRLQEIIITRDGLGRILQFGGDSIFAVFDNASAAVNRALEIQRVLDTCGQDGPADEPVRIRIGLHMGEVLVKEGERLEIISRHVNRAHRVMEAAVPGQILASDVVMDSARDFLEVPREHQAIRNYGEFYLKGVGATALCEIVDTRFRKPEPPRIATERNPQTALFARLEAGGYRAGARLGESAYGVVYEATQIATGKKVALKVLNPALSEEAPARERLLKQLSQTTKLVVPGVALIIEHRLGDHPAFVVQEFIEGAPADAVLEGASNLRIARAFADLCRTLNQAQAAGAVHGNLKPGNVLIRDDDSVAVLDFGIAEAPGALSRSPAGTGFRGNPAYLAPEVIQGNPSTPKSDLYSVGVLLFKVLTGREPFTGDTVHEIVQGHLHEDPPPLTSFNPAVAEGLQRICLKALEKLPAERYQNAGEMRDDLERFLRGELIQTRPSVYDNLLFHRVQKHIQEIKQWTGRGLLSSEESHRLLSSYEGLQRRGLPAVMEGRLFRLWQTLVYIGGWAVINGALLWLVQYWPHLSRSARLLLGSVPAATTFVLALGMWRMKRFRLFFVALIVAILATPLLTGVWLHEFRIAATVASPKLEVFHTRSDSDAITNEQIFLTALATFVVAAAAAAFTRTTTHSAQALGALTFGYVAFLCLNGLVQDQAAEEWAKIAIKLIPLLLATSALGTVLVAREPRYHQAGPWIYFSALLLIGICYAVALKGLEEWKLFSPEHRVPISWIMLSWFGVLQTAMGLIGRRWLQHHCRLATRGVIFIGLVNILVGLALAGWKETWPGDWPTLALFANGKPLPWPHVVLPLAALLITLLACRYQLIAFLLVGLSGMAFSVHVLGHHYFENVPLWPKALMAFGAVCFFAALFRELRRTRGNVLDDVVGQARL